MDTNVTVCGPSFCYIIWNNRKYVNGDIYINVLTHTPQGENIDLPL